MAHKRKTWQQKLHNGGIAKVERLDKKFADIPEGASMLVATPEIVDAYIRSIPEGTHTSLLQMRKDLAAAHNAEHTCPLTSGIFLRIAAEAAWEQYIAGAPIGTIAPFWRMIDHRSPVCKKLTFGTGFIQEQRGKEGLAW